MVMAISPDSMSVDAKNIHNLLSAISQPALYSAGDMADGVISAELALSMLNEARHGLVFFRELNESGRVGLQGFSYESIPEEFIAGIRDRYLAFSELIAGYIPSMEGLLSYAENSSAWRPHRVMLQQYSREAKDTMQNLHQFYYEAYIRLTIEEFHRKPELRTPQAMLLLKDYLQAKHAKTIEALADR